MHREYSGKHAKKDRLHVDFVILSSEELSNIGGAMVFFAIIFLLILVPLTIVEKVVQRNSEKRCSAIANGTYAGTKVYRTQRKHRSRHGEPAPLVYEQVRYYAQGEDILTSPRSTHGITSKTEIGAPLVIHYDPNEPRYCWAQTPSAKVGVSIWVKIFAACAVVAFALGMVLISLS